jgi:hypothetical protein
MAVTSTPAPVVTNEVIPTAIMPSMQTSAVPVQLKIDAALLPRTKAITPPSDNIEISRKSAFALGAAFLAAAGGLAVFMFRRVRKTSGDNPIGSSVKKD